MDNILITVLGPTASGKTSLGVKLAATFTGEILSADSRQVYKGMDIGTGKDLKEYICNGQRINYHLIDIADPSEEFNLYRFKQKFIEAYKTVTSAGNLPIMVGGTGMYLSAIIQDYKLKEGDFNETKYAEFQELSEEELRSRILEIKTPHNKTDFDSKDRMIKALLAESGDEEISFPVKNCVIGVLLEREEVKNRITVRLKQRLESGMIEESEKLMASGVTLEKMLFFGLEYKYLGLYLSGQLNYNDMFQKLNSSIHSFAKRQMTWYRKMEKEGVEIHWVKAGEYQEAENIVKEFLRNVR